MKILLVDDDPLTLEALDACLRSEGFPTLAAKSGTEALALWERHRPNLICLDIMMANMDGYEVCRQIRAKDTVTPILFLSAKNEEIDVVLGFCAQTVRQTGIARTHPLGLASRRRSRTQGPLFSDA